MQRLSEGELFLVKTMIESGESLAQISQITGRRKSTLYFHYKKILGKKFQEPKFETNFSEIEGEIAGIFAGDGSQHYQKSNWQYQVNVHFGNLEYAEYVKQLFDKYFNKNFRLTKESKGRYRLRSESKKIFNHFKNYLDYVPQVKHSTVRLKHLDFPTGFKIGFLRGLVDTDGTICKCKDNRIRVAFTTTSETLANQTKSLLEGFGFKAFITTPKTRRLNLKDCHSTYLFNGSVKPFIRLVGPYKARKFGALSVEANTHAWQA